MELNKSDFGNSIINIEFTVKYDWRTHLTEEERLS
jgi:hypothetical protein